MEWIRIEQNNNNKKIYNILEYMCVCLSQTHAFEESTQNNAMFKNLFFFIYQQTLVIHLWIIETEAQAVQIDL